MLRKVNDAIHVLDWKENITLKNIEVFRQEMNNLLTQENNKLMLNLAETSYINSAGLGIIAESVIQARQTNKELVIASIQQSIKEIFVIVKFSSFMKLFDTEEEAIEFLMVTGHA